MSSSVAVSQAGRDVPSRAQADAREGWVQRRVALAWYLLVLNCLTYSPGGLLHLPSAGGKAITQGSLYAALFVALTVNRRIILRPNVFLSLVSLLILGALITIIEPQYLGTVYRTFRLTTFITVLWLLTPWWSRRDLLLVRCHLRALSVVLGTVVLGLMTIKEVSELTGLAVGTLYHFVSQQIIQQGRVLRRDHGVPAAQRICHFRAADEFDARFEPRDARIAHALEVVR